MVESLALTERRAINQRWVKCPLASSSCSSTATKASLYRRRKGEKVQKRRISNNGWEERETKLLVDDEKAGGKGLGRGLSWP